MAKFLPAYEAMIRREGGYTLVNDPRDRGGMTYAGISRRSWPGWGGWRVIDQGGEPEAQIVRLFYYQHFWRPIRGDEIAHQSAADAIFDMAVNAGVKTAVILAQTVVGTTPDGVLGPKTLEAINAQDPALFAARYALARIARYVAIVRRDRTQAVFLLGWITRALEVAA